MNFTNLQVDVAQIPQTEILELQPIEPTYLKALRLMWAIIFSILLVAGVTLFVLVDDWQNTIAMLIAAVLFILTITLTAVIGTGSFRRKSFAVRTHDIVYKNGWIFQDTHIVPFSRIQHVVVNSGPIDRKYGLASLTLYTAAAEVNDITIPGLTLEKAEQLKSFIINQVKPSKSHEGLE